MRQVIRIAMGLWLAGAGGGSTKAETADSRELKAAFLFNFTRFVEWPPSAFASANAPFVICMVGGDDMKLTLFAVTRDKIAEGRALKVLRIGAGSARSCH